MQAQAQARTVGKIDYCAAPRFKVACPWLGCCKTCRRTGVTASKRHSINGAKVHAAGTPGVTAVAFGACALSVLQVEVGGLGRWRL